MKGGYRECVCFVCMFFMSIVTLKDYWYKKRLYKYFHICGCAFLAPLFFWYEGRL